MTKAQQLCGQVSDEDRKIIERTLTQQSLSSRQRERLEMVKGAYRGDSLAVIASWSGRTAPTVQRWLIAYREGGIDALIDQPRSGRPAQADATYLSELEAAADADPRTLGQSFDVWTSSRLSAYVAEITGTLVSPVRIREILKRAGCAHGRPKHSVSHLQDPAEVATCEDRLREVEKKGSGGA